MTAAMFLSGEIKDHQNWSVDQYFTMTFVEMEKYHDWIQWAFPLPTASKYNKLCPILTKEDALLIAIESLDTVNKMVDHFLNFLKNDERRIFSRGFDHNFMRISRMLKFLRLIGYSEKANEIFDNFLTPVIKNNDVDPEAVTNWCIAADWDWDRENWDWDKKYPIS